MKNILSKIRPQVSIKTLLHDRMGGLDAARESEYIHASAMTSENREFCPREFALTTATKKYPRPSRISPALRHTYDMGVDIQRRVNENYLRDLMWGHWTCVSCKTQHSYAKGLDQCPSCTSPVRYEEVRVFDPKTTIGGGLDALLEVAPNDVRLVEIKSVDKDAAKTLKAPLSEHRVRTRLYLRLMDEDQYLRARIPKVNLSVAHILYVAKSFGFKNQGHGGDLFSPFIEFQITRDDAEIEPYLRMGRAVAQSVGGATMPYGVCANSSSGRAQKCPVVSECFSGSYPWGPSWR